MVNSYLERENPLSSLTISCIGCPLQRGQPCIHVYRSNAKWTVCVCVCVTCNSNNFKGTRKEFDGRGRYKRDGEALLIEDILKIN